MQRLQNNKLLRILLILLLLAVAVAYYLRNFASDSIQLPAPEATSENPQQTLPNFAQYKNVSEKKQAFFAFLYPIIVEENQHVLNLRDSLLKLQALYPDSITETQQAWLNAMAKRYRVSAKLDHNQQITELLNKVDFIPPALALTQAAIESGWGSSRFAKQGNNLFGQWCFSKGCGMVPQSRDPDKSHEVAKFNSVNQAIRAYIHNLNTNQSYQALRNTRAKLRSDQQPVSGKPLALTLLSYSEQGQIYIDKLISVMRQNKLETFAQTQPELAKAD